MRNRGGEEGSGPLREVMFGYRRWGFSITEHIASRTIALPFYNNLTEGEVDYVVENLDDILRSID